ncbi:MAG: hypothetical protein M3Q34_02040 [bacterium]|nr:hypothetical protein [bacterium]
MDSDLDYEMDHHPLGGVVGPQYWSFCPHCFEIRKGRKSGELLRLT